MLDPLCAIVDADAASAAGWRPLDLATAFLDGGARFLQVRAKHMASGPLLDLCDQIVERARSSGALIIVNDRVDIARASGAGGVHVGQEDLPPSAARELLGDDGVIGFSTHTSEQVDSAVAGPITYIATGPIFGTTTKDTGYSAVGFDLVRYAAKASALPVVAIGGITLENAASVREAGAASVAVIGDLLRGGDPVARVRQYLRVLG
jgi:thiamine-phosphate diphosphorylase